MYLLRHYFSDFSLNYSTSILKPIDQCNDVAFIFVMKEKHVLKNKVMCASYLTNNNDL